MTELFAKQVLKAVLWGHGEAAMNKPQHRDAVEKAYYIARQQLRTANEHILYPIRVEVKQ